MNQTEEKYDKYILCANRYEAQKRFHSDILVFISYYGAITIKQSDLLICIDNETRHYIYPAVADGIQKVNKLEVDASAIQLLPLKELMTYILIFRINISLTRHPSAHIDMSEVIK